MTGEPTSLTVRRYDPRDRDAVASVAFATGFFGESLGEWIDDTTIFTRTLEAYLDAEDRSAFVAETAGRIAGYVVASRKARLSSAVTAVTGTLIDLLRLPRMTRRDRRWVLQRLSGAVSALAGEERSFRTPPGMRLHINLLPEQRSGGRGRQLMTGLLADLAARGEEQVHANSWQMARNPTHPFWIALGFEEYSRVRSRVWRPFLGDEPVEMVCYVRSVTPGSPTSATT